MKLLLLSLKEINLCLLLKKFVPFVLKNLNKSESFPNR